MSGVQEGKGRPLNQLITLSSNLPSSHSLTLPAVCSVVPSCCSQKCRLGITARTTDQTEGLQEVEINLPVHRAVVPSDQQCRIACRRWTTGSGRSA